MAVGGNLSYIYPSAGEYTAACRVRDSIADSEDPTRRPVIATIKVITHAQAPPPAAPDVSISYQFDPYNPFHVTFSATVDGGVPRQTLPFYLIFWDLNYNGQNFNFDATGDQYSEDLSTLSVFTVACRVEDGIPNEVDPDHRPVVKTMKVIPLPPEVALNYDLDKDNPLLVHFRADVQFGVSQTPQSPYTIAWDFDYDGNFHADALGADLTKQYDKLGYHTVACMVEDGVADNLDPDHRPVLKTINVIPPPPSMQLYYSIDDNDPLSVSFIAYVSGGVPNYYMPLYDVEWDFNYDGVDFKSQAAGYTASNKYDQGGTYRAACRVRDSIDDSLDPDHRPAIGFIDITIH